MIPVDTRAALLCAECRRDWLRASRMRRSGRAPARSLPPASQPSVCCVRFVTKTLSSRHITTWRSISGHATQTALARERSKLRGPVSTEYLLWLNNFRYSHEQRLRQRLKRHQILQSC